jgi:hypothetical protein
MTGLSLCFSSQVLGPEHPSVAESYNNLALVTCAMRADAEARGGTRAHRYTRLC